MNAKLHLDYGVRMTTVIGFHPLWGNADYFNGALYNPAQAVQLNSSGNVLLGTGNPYNGMVIPGLSKFPSSAQGRVLAASSPICDGASCNSLFDPSLPQSYIHATNDFQPRLGIAYQLNGKTVLRAGAGEFVTSMPLLDNIFPGGNSPFQPFVTISNVRVDNPGASLVSGTAASITATTLNPNLKQPVAGIGMLPSSANCSGTPRFPSLTWDTAATTVGMYMTSTRRKRARCRRTRV